MSDEPAEKPVTGMARRLANLKRYPKGETGNRSGRPTDIVRFGDLLMKEFCKTVAAPPQGPALQRRNGWVRLPNAMPGSTLS